MANEPRTLVPVRSDLPVCGRSSDDFSALAHRIYDAGLHPERWTATIAAIARSMGSDKGLLFTPRLAPQHGGLVFPAGIEERAIQLWGARFIDKDIWAQQAIAKGFFCGNQCWTDAELVPDEEFLASSFYRDFLSDIDIRYVCGGVVFDEGTGLPVTCLSIFRGVAQAPFQREDVEWLRRLIPHVSRSLGFMQRLEMYRAQVESTRASFDRLPFGVVLLGHDMAVVHVNAAAREVLERRDGLTLDAAGVLDGASREGPGGLADWLRGMRNANLLEHPHFCDGFSVERAGHGAPQRYFVQCAPVPPAAGCARPSHDVCFVAFITDPVALRLPARERLVSIFQMTRAQAETALELASGASYKAVARKLRVSEETVRSHVKEIYPKARVNRQADLVRLVLSLAQVAV